MDMNISIDAALPMPEEEKKAPSDLQGHCAYISSAVVLSLGPSQLISSIVLIAKTISSIWNGVKLCMNSLCITVRESQLKSLKNRITVFQGNPASKDAEIQRLDSLLTINRTEQQEALATLKENAHSFVVALLGMVPLIGILSAGAYAAAVGKGGSTGSFSERSATGASLLLLDFLSKIPPLKRLGKRLFFPLSYDKSLYKPYPNISIKRIFDFFSELRKLKESGKKSITLVEIDHLLQQAVDDHDLPSIHFLKILKENPQTEFALNECGQHFLDIATYAMRAANAEIDSLKVDLPVERGDGKKHSITLHERKTDNPTARTMVLFHGNGCIGLDMLDLAEFYHKNNWNVVMVTMGGYPESDLATETTETTAIQDVKAVLNMVEKRGVEQIGVLGHSIGTALAMHATQLSDKVQFAILDKPFSSAKNVAANVVSHSEEEVPILKCVPSAFIRALITPSFPEGRIVPGVLDQNGQAYYTDGLDNVSKAKKFRKPIICIGGNHDDMMGYNPIYDSSGTFSHFGRTFADDIGAVSQNTHIITTHDTHVQLSSTFLEDRVMRLLENS